MIVLDTDALSELMRPRPASRLVARLERVPAAEQATTAITLGEIAYGARQAGKPALYDRALGLLRGVTILDFDRAAAERYGEIRLASSELEYAWPIPISGSRPSRRRRNGCHHRQPETLRQGSGSAGRGLDSGVAGDGRMSLATAAG